MTRLRFFLLLLVFAPAAACGAFKDAMTAHVDLVARAGSQELRVNELADMLAESRAPLRPDVARTIAQIWVNYHLLGQAAASGDSLGTPKEAERGMWSAVEQVRLQKMYEAYVSQLPPPDSVSYEEAYNRGELLAAAHILLAKRPETLGLGNDSIRREADRIAETVTSATFARVARQRSDDPGSKDRGGDYGVFPPGQMVQEFDQGVLSVPPGGITKVVETQFGYHIIRRSTYAEVRDQFEQAYEGLRSQKAESTFFASAEDGANVQVRRGAAKLVKAIAEDVDGYRNDKSVIATSRRGNLTAARLADWMAAFPPQAQVRAQVLQAPDTLIPLFVMNVMRNELLLKRADSLGLTLDPDELTDLHQAFWGATIGTMRALGVSPQQLSDSADGVAAREQLAARRLDDYLRGLFANEREFVEVPEPVVLVLREKFETRVVNAALDRALAEATRRRAVADSLLTSGEPPSAVPMPGPR